MSAERLHRNVDEFSGRHNVREADTVSRMATVAGQDAGKWLCHNDLVADSGLPSRAQMV